MIHCFVLGCTNEYYAKGYCYKHYQRNKKYGTPNTRKGDHVPLEEKFWKEVDKNGASVTSIGTPCWLWTGYAPKGYGRVWLNGRNERAHRAAWIMANGPIPNDLLVLHRCDTTLCVNVGHLFLGTHIDNVEDCIRKGRRKQGDHKGERHAKAKFTNADILEIRADSRSHVEVAKERDVDRSTICDIRNRKTWRHIP